MVEIKNCDLNLCDTITCGQLFRFFKLDDNTYDVVIKDRVINVSMNNDTLIIKSSNEDNLENIVLNYFDFDHDYNIIRDKIINIDNDLKDIVNSSKGLRMLRQDPLEMVISYIVSANNKVERIQKSINLLCERYGKKIEYNNKIYYLFPDIETLNTLTVENLRDLKIGFRDKYVYGAIKKIYNKEIDLNYINELNSEDAIKYLMQIKGIGYKVASCILLFGYNRFDVFPVDTWAIKQMCNIYDIKPTQKEVIKFAKEKYKDLSAIVLQYMFHTLRNK